MHRIIGFRKGLGTFGSKSIACHGAILAAAIAAGAGIARGDPIVLGSDPSATHNQQAYSTNGSTTLNVTFVAVDGTTVSSTTGWAPEATDTNTQVLGGEGLGGNIAVFPISTTPSGSQGTDLTFDLYQLYTPIGQKVRIGGFEIEVTTDTATTPAVSSAGVLTGSFSPVMIESVASSTGITTFTVDPNPATAATYGDYVIAQNYSGATEPTNAQDTYEVTAFSTLTGITGIELIAFYTLPGDGTGTATAGEGDGIGLDQANFVLTDLTGTATAVAAPEPTALGVVSLGSLLLLRRRRRVGVGNGCKSASVPGVGNASPPLRAS